MNMVSRGGNLLAPHDSDFEEVNGSILNRLSLHLRATIIFYVHFHAGLFKNTYTHLSLLLRVCESLSTFVVIIKDNQQANYLTTIFNIG